MIATLALALLPQAQFQGSGLEERIRRGGEQAAELFSRVVPMDVGNAGARLAHALALISLGRHDEALAGLFAGEDFSPLQERSQSVKLLRAGWARGGRARKGVCVRGGGGHWRCAV